MKANPALIGVTLCAFASATTLRAVDPLLPQLAADFGTLPGAVAILITVYTVAYGGVQFVSGRIGDRWGKPRMIAAATLAAAAATAACAFAPGINPLMGLRAVAGACAGGIIPMAIAFVGDTVAYERRQQAMTRLASVQILGTIAGQVGAGLVGSMLGWRGVLLLLAAMFATGGIVLALALRGTAVATSPAGQKWAGYGWVASPRARMVLSTILLEGVFFYAGLAFVASDLQARLGLSLAESGMSLLLFGAGGLAFSLTFGRYMTHLPRGRTPLLGGAMLALGFAGLAAAPTAAVAAIALLPVGWGFYAMHSTLQTEATQMLPEARGHAVATFAATFFSGQAIGVLAAGYVFDRFGGPPIFAASAFVLVALALRFSRKLAADYR
ncbi:MAG: MFS transporter [Proteobacteria bacterium]|nr:MFS transporter [Pseudomonadota bacterium]